MGTPEFFTSWSEVWVTWEPLNLRLASKVSSVLLGKTPLTYGVCTNSNLHCSIVASNQLLGADQTLTVSHFLLKKMNPHFDLKHTMSFLEI